MAESVGGVLPIYGADLFDVSPSTFAPLDNIPITPDYLIGPGDEIRLQVWGQVNQRGSYFVDRTGSISLPEVGTVHVAGIQFSQLAPFLKSQLGRVFRNFDLNVNLGQLRSIQVFVVGQARQPGSYTIGSLSTLLNALFASGGPLPQGSVRDIQVKRNGNTITHFDLYDLLLHGDKSKDVPLSSGDVIFIPDVGAQVAVTGSVTTPAIYELRDENSLAQVIALAGGLTSLAASSRIMVERIYQHTERSEIEVELSEAGSAHAQNGDILFLKSIMPRFNDTVTLRGNVANAGRYVWHPGMRVSDLIPSRDALVTRRYYQNRNQLGLNKGDYGGPLDQAQNLLSNQSANGTVNRAAQQGTIGLQTGGSAELPGARTSTGNSEGRSSLGSVLASGNRNFPAQTDVVLSAPDIDWDYAVIERQSKLDLTTSLVPFNLGKVVLDKDDSQNFLVLPGDVVTIFSKADIRLPSAQQTKFVKLEGEFKQAGIYSVEPGETLRHLLARAGGFTNDADLFASEFTRESVRRLQRQRLMEYVDTLEAEMTARTSASLTSSFTERDAAAAQSSEVEDRTALARLRESQPSGRIILQVKPDSHAVTDLPDIALEDGDRFVVPRVPSSIAVEGQVYSANAFVYEKGRRVKDYLSLAGGPDRIADQKREYILRADGSVVSHQYATSRQRGHFNGLLVLPGDTIVVPPKLDKGALLRNLLNVSTIIQGFGLGAAAIEVLK